jgi:hypothetical protein
VTTINGKCVSGKNATCPTVPAGEDPLHCQNLADCSTTPGTVCCGDLVVGTAVTTTCKTPGTGGSCGTNSFLETFAQLCVTDSECANGMSCVRQSCISGEATLSMCGLQSESPFSCVAAP